MRHETGHSHLYMDPKWIVKRLLSSTELKASPPTNKRAGSAWQLRKGIIGSRKIGSNEELVSMASMGFTPL